jgi:hypothetical protein
VQGYRVGARRQPYEDWAQFGGRRVTKRRRGVGQQTDRGTWKKLQSARAAGRLRAGIGDVVSAILRALRSLENLSRSHLRSASGTYHIHAQKRADKNLLHKSLRGDIAASEKINIDLSSMPHQALSTTNLGRTYRGVIVMIHRHDPSLITLFGPLLCI